MADNTFAVGALLDANKPPIMLAPLSVICGTRSTTLRARTQLNLKRTRTHTLKPPVRVAPPPVTASPASRMVNRPFDITVVANSPPELNAAR